MTGLIDTTAKRSPDIDITWASLLFTSSYKCSEFLIYWTCSPEFWAFQSPKFRFVHISVLMLCGNRSFRYKVAHITVLHGQSMDCGEVYRLGLETWVNQVPFRIITVDSRWLGTIANSNLALTQTKIDFPRISFIACLHLTLLRLSWWSRTKAFLSFGNLTPFSCYSQTRSSVPVTNKLMNSLMKKWFRLLIQ